ncbi:hypothetical protein AMQ84_30760 [Paenibacillus riograndensis]|uniref:Uncharacterized protein n=1 Tax=Paenibacillus riograndensis TaxID=483937 RepID=A0A132TDG4_9BACL|nr:hypothetical protein AMQ84_30760 [Paenibacillus riograndensis]KWX84856.1 hypothetical protein AMQ83_28220 [Paenibacillus riograndensis]
MHLSPLPCGIDESSFNKLLSCPQRLRIEREGIGRSVFAGFFVGASWKKGTYFSENQEILRFKWKK